MSLESIPDKVDRTAMEVHEYLEKYKVIVLFMSVVLDYFYGSLSDSFQHMLNNVCFCVYVDHTWRTVGAAHEEGRKVQGESMVASLT